VLILGFLVICLLAIVVVIDASAAFLQHRALRSAADAAALAAAREIDLSTYYATGATGVHLDPTAARATITSYLRQIARATGHPVRLESVRVEDRQVAVTVVSTLRLPISGLVTGRQIVRADAAARVSVAGLTPVGGTG
jgi:uncharacterized membrane protein